MRVLLTLICLALLAASPAARAQTANGGASAKAETSPALEEAARLTEQVVKLYAAGKYEEALPAAVRALELREKELGRDDKLVAGALLNLAAVERSLDKLEESKEHYRRSAAAFEKAGDASVRELILALEGEARAESDIYKVIGLHERALALKEKTFGPDSPEVARSLFPLGHLSDLSGRRKGAAAYFRRFVEVMEKTKAGAEDDVAVAYLRLGCLAGREGRRDEAEAFEKRADEVFEAVRDKRGPVQGGVINGKAVSKPQPSYPSEAKFARAQGTITVAMLIGENGTVLSACAFGVGHPSLKAASEFAAYRARFTPTLVDGKPVKVRGVITYNFVLR
jgi:tetratricopeptide (TPR) repeat protein